MTAITAFKTALVAELPSLRAFAMSLAGSHDRADDLVQETVVKAWTAQGSFQEGTSLRAWLFTIMRNLNISAGRQTQRRGPHLALDEHLTPRADATQDHAIDVRDLLATLGSLPEEHCSLLLLVGVEDLTYEQAAAALGIPVGTVMSRLSRARRRLRDLLEHRAPVSLRRIK